MHCNRCGKKIEPSWKFCRYCGAPVSASGNKKRSNGKRPQEKSGPDRSNGRAWLVASFVLLLVITTIGGLKYFHDKPKNDSRDTLNVDSAVEIELPRLDAKTYFEERSAIVQVIDAMESETVPTEKQVAEQLSECGFVSYPIITDYTMDGAFHPNSSISSTSSKKHPVYKTYYMSSGGDYWTIYVINGTILAYPISYNLQSTHGVKLIISESKTMMSYDSIENKYYEIIPNESELILKTIDQINSSSLDALTNEVIETL